MRYPIFKAGLVASVLLLGACASTDQKKATEIQIRYGKVTEISRVPMPSMAPAGAMVGGFTGLMLGRNLNPGRQVASGIGGAVLGGLATRALEGERLAYQYKILFRNEENGFYVTENGFLQIDDCIAVERGKYANMRRVSDALCEGPRLAQPEPSNVVEAKQCQDAKEQLLAAKSNEEIELTSRKVRILCQF